MVKRIPLVLLAGLMMMAGCAQEDNLNTGEKAQQYLEQFIQKYYPYVTPNEYGIFVLEDTPGNGQPWSQDSLYTYASTAIRSLGGTIASTQDEPLARQLGTYVKGNYYGPRFQQTGENLSYAGLDALLKGMRAGGTRKAIIPACLLTTGRYSTFKEYLEKGTQEQSLEYTVTLGGQVNDIDRMERDSLASYVLRTYGKDIKPVNYTGMLLNGQVFDTTLEKVAKDAGIYNAARTYTAANLIVTSNYTEIKLNDNSVIEGFRAGIAQMHWVGQKGVVLFVSNLGYTNSGSGQTIPPYSPLLFELELL